MHCDATIVCVDEKGVLHHVGCRDQFACAIACADRLSAPLQGGGDFKSVNVDRVTEKHSYATL
jgi:hypothetical protein